MIKLTPSPYLLRANFSRGLTTMLGGHCLRAPPHAVGLPNWILVTRRSLTWSSAMRCVRLARDLWIWFELIHVCAFVLLPDSDQCMFFLPDSGVDSENGFRFSSVCDCIVLKRVVAKWTELGFFDVLLSLRVL